MNYNLLDEVGSLKDGIQPSLNPMSVGLCKLKPAKSTNQKKIDCNVKKSRSVTIQIPMSRRSVTAKSTKPKYKRNVLLEPENLMSVVDILEPQ